MKAITLDELGARPTFREELARPTPGPRDIVVRVHASSVNPVDNAIAAGMLKDMVEHEFPITLGRDYAGVIEQVGADVTGFSVGDEVFGFVGAMNPTVHAGTWVELLVVAETLSIAHKPDSLEFSTAGVAPLAGITAMSAIDVLTPAPGDTLLVIGATGGVGSVAVQLAAHAGATVIAPALPEDELYLRELGVADIVPRDGDVTATVRERYPDGVDALLDNVSYAPGAYEGALKDSARVASPNNAAGEGRGRTNLMAAPTSENLTRLGGMLGSGIVKVPIHQAYGLEHAPAAMNALATHHIQGKLALQLAE
jgi:NADPH:quinone reductase-like Zn-dependent oxidoreductase